MRIRFRKISFKQAIGEGIKDTIAVSLIAWGVNQINQGNVIVGGGLVTIGWILIVIDRYLL